MSDLYTSLHAIKCYLYYRCSSFCHRGIGAIRINRSRFILLRYVYNIRSDITLSRHDRTSYDISRDKFLVSCMTKKERERESNKKEREKATQTQLGRVANKNEPCPSFNYTAFSIIKMFFF